MVWVKRVGFKVSVLECMGQGFTGQYWVGICFGVQGGSVLGVSGFAGGSIWVEVSFSVSPHTTPGPAAKEGAQDAPQPVPVPPALLPAAAASQGRGLPVPGPGPPVTPATLALGRGSQGPPQPL